MAVANLNPQSILNTEVDFSTTDTSSGNPITEPFTVSGPNDSGIIVNNLSAGKAVIQLTTSTAEGASYLKIWYPQPSSNSFFVTYATKNSSWTDGYADYGTTVSTTFKSDLQAWIAQGRTFPHGTQPLFRTLTFTAYGINTNQPSAARQFTVVFSFAPTVVTPILINPVSK
jgi:hypothetical protein